MEVSGRLTGTETIQSQESDKVDLDFLTSFDPPGSINTWTMNINKGGDITFYYETPNAPDGEQIWHGFLLSSQGTITSFDPPGSTQTFANSTIGWSINDLGVIVGAGFLRLP